jgi:hypothetical protein
VSKSLVQQEAPGPGGGGEARVGLPETPRPRLCPRAAPIQAVRARPVLHGLHHVDERAA